MAELALQVGGRTYSIACRNGEEAHLTALAATVDRKVRDARSAVGDTSEPRQLLLAALLLADELQEQAGTAPTNADALEQYVGGFETTANKIEELAARLENRG